MSIVTPQAQTQTGFLSEFLNGIFKTNLIPTGPGATTKFIISIISNGLILLFVGVIIAAIIYSAIAGLKYIQSQGDSEKVKEAGEALKSVLFGVAAVFIGVIGVIVITGIFSSQTSDSVRRALCTFLEPGTSIENCIDGSKL